VAPAQKIETQRLTTTEAALLALLAIEGERSAYDLQQLVSRAIGHVWSPARSGLYAALPRLVSLGLAQSRSVAQSSRSDKHLYRITRDGRRSLEFWLETVEPGARETFFLKLFVGGLTTPDVLIEHVEQFLADTDARLEEYREIEKTNSNRGHDWFHRHLLRYALLRAEHELEWADSVLRALRRGPQ